MQQGQFDKAQRRNAYPSYSPTLRNDIEMFEAGCLEQAAHGVAIRYQVLQSLKEILVFSMKVGTSGCDTASSMDTDDQSCGIAWAI